MSGDGESGARARLEEWVADSENRLRANFDLSGAGVFIVRDDLTLNYANQAFARMLGGRPSDLLGHPITEFGPHDQHTALRAGIVALRNGHATAISLERNFLHRDGRQIAAAVSVHMLPIPPELQALAARDENSRRYVGIAYDITDRRIAENQLRENQRLLEEAQRLARIGHWTWTLSTDNVVFSDQMYRMFGVERGSFQITRRALTDFVVAEDRPILGEAFASLLSGAETAVAEFRIRCADGELREVIGRAIPERAPDDRLITLVGTLQDITEQKRQEATLREAKTNAEAANRAKTNFLAAMSHELRTPLNAILGFAQLLSLRAHGPLTPLQTSYVANIVQGGEHLLHLINDVLDLARIDTGKLTLNLDHVEIDPVIQNVVEDFRQMARTRGVSLRFIPGGPFVAQADRMRLVQVLVNLASNAIKYNRQDGSVMFSVRAPQRGTIRITVQDTGRGIPLDRQSEVFESFNRLGAEATGEEGTGIGLSLSKRLTEEMGGKMGFESTPGVGSLFWVDLPAAQDAHIISPAEAPTMAG